MMCMSHLELCTRMIVTKCDICQARSTIGNKLAVPMAARRRSYSTLNAVTELGNFQENSEPDQGVSPSGGADSGTRRMRRSVILPVPERRFAESGLLAVASVLTLQEARFCAETTGILRASRDAKRPGIPTMEVVIRARCLTAHGSHSLTTPGALTSSATV